MNVNMENDFDIRDARMPENEREYENVLRPLSLRDFSGQAKVVDNQMWPLPKYRELLFIR